MPRGYGFFLNTTRTCLILLCPDPLRTSAPRQLGGECSTNINETAEAHQRYTTRLRPQPNLTQNMIHEITRNEITRSNTNVSCQFVSLVRVVSWIAIVYSNESAQENKKLTVCYAQVRRGNQGTAELRRFWRNSGRTRRRRGSQCLQRLCALQKFKGIGEKHD